ncbi:hypothetical protein R6Q57_006406 [Mikania cordata]
METDRKGFKKVVEDMIKVPVHMSRRRKIAMKLQKLKAEVQEVCERRKRFTFDEKSGYESRDSRNASIDGWQRKEEMSLFVDEDEIVGMGDNKDKLMEWLMEDDPR